MPVEIDLSTAPEGATHVVADIYSLRESQVKMNTEHPYRKYVDGDWYAFVDGSWVYVLDAEPSRYQLIPAPWNGEGLPPVGTVCEALHGLKEQWMKVRILDHEGSVQTAVCRDSDNRLWWSQNFRPIRTPEQIAAEEREKAIEEMAAVAHRQGQPFVTKREMAARLYDAGYRKQVAP
jgi:hypothetical protein